MTSVTSARRSIPFLRVVPVIYGLLYHVEILNVNLDFDERSKQRGV